MANPDWQLDWHLKLFGRAACKPLAKDQRADHKLTIIRSDVTCEKCQVLVRQQWGELVASQPERTEEQVIETPIYTRAVDKSVKSASLLARGREVALASDIGVQVPAARPKSRNYDKIVDEEIEPHILAARKALNLTT